MSRTAIALLSTDNLIHNMKVLRQEAPASQMVAMVKANAYGHGLRQTAARLESFSSLLGVASIDEALALRDSGIKAPILLMEGVFEASELIIASLQQFEVVFHAAHQIAWLESLSLPAPIHAWLKVDTGMSRLGFKVEDAAKAFERLQGSGKIEGALKIMSHLACADDPAHPLNEIQLKNFREQIAPLSSHRSICNSAGIFRFKESHYETVRSGLALYGASPLLQTSATELNLKPVMTLTSKLIDVKRVPKGQTLGYGARTVCSDDKLIGVIAFGYGDGYPQTAVDGTPILVHGHRCSLLGRISMDMMTVDVTECPNVQVGSPVVLWGEGLSIEEVALATGQSAYSLLTSIQNRVKFKWSVYDILTTS